MTDFGRLVRRVFNLHVHVLTYPASRPPVVTVYVPIMLYSQRSCFSSAKAMVSKIIVHVRLYIQLMLYCCMYLFLVRRSLRCSGNSAIFITKCLIPSHETSCYWTKPFTNKLLYTQCVKHWALRKAPSHVLYSIQ